MSRSKLEQVRQKTPASFAICSIRRIMPLKGIITALLVVPRCGEWRPSQAQKTVDDEFIERRNPKLPESLGKRILMWILPRPWWTFPLTAYESNLSQKLMHETMS